MKLKDVLGEIEADGANLVHERLLEWALTPPLWHAEAVGGRPHHQAPSATRTSPRAMDLVVEQVEAEGRLRLRLAIELRLESPDRFGCLQAHRQSPLLLAFGSALEVRVLPSAGVTRP